MTCYLHIGMPKTGTTSVQNFLYTNRELLKKQDFLYPISAKYDHKYDHAHHYFAFCLNTYFKTNDKEALDKNLKQLQDEIESSNTTHTIIFSEILPDTCNTAQKVAYLQSVLRQIGFTNIIVVAYLRNTADMYVSMFSQRLKGFLTDSKVKRELLPQILTPPKDNKNPEIYYNYKQVLQNFAQVFGKESMIVRLFDKNEFEQGDLLKDFLSAVGLAWDNDFVIPKNQNETLDLLGIEIARNLYKHDFPLIQNDVIASKIYAYTTKSLTSKDPNLKFMPKKDMYEAYLEFYADSNEWVRAEFFPQRQSLFPPKDLGKYKENYTLREMKEEYWERVAQFIADILSDLINATNTLESRKSASFIQADSALARVQDELPYKLGEALAQNTKSLLGFVRLPFVLSYITERHNAKHRIYSQELAQGNALTLPPLSSYSDYEQALKLQRSFVYNLGKALIVYDKNGEAKLSYMRFVGRVLGSIRRNKGMHKQLAHLSNEQKI